MVFSKMKTQLLFGVLLACLLIGVRSDADSSEEWDEREEECVNELELDKAAIQAINNGDIFNGVPEDNVEYNNYLACYWKKKGGLEEDGTINIANVHTEFLAEFHKEFGSNPDTYGIIVGGMLRTAIFDCSEDETIKGKTDGEAVAKLQNCVLKKVKKTIEEASEDR